MHVAIIGTGFVGVVTSAVYASFGNTVVGLDINEERVNSLKQGKVPFYEPDLENLLVEEQKKGNLTFTTDYAAAITPADVVMVAVGTPSGADGQADLSAVFGSLKQAAPHLKENVIVVIKSTVPPGTLDEVEKQLSAVTQTKFHLASLPEFLREGSAVYDTLHPDRVVIGASDPYVFEQLETLHKPLNAPIIKVSPSSAQMAKYTANAFLALRITFINQIADLCEKNNADIQEVIAAISPDKRIGGHYWYPGFGYGGSCFPKDVSELAAYSRSVGEENNLFNKMHELNTGRIPELMQQYGQQIGGWSGKTIAVLGLSFKPNTNDMREAPSLKAIPHLLEQQAKVVAYDPKAIEEAQKLLPASEQLTYVDQIETAVAKADVILALIEWPEIINFNFGSTKEAGKEQWLIDARNQFTPETVVNWGYRYLGIGR